MGGTDAAPKTVMLFVPYWIRNDSSVPLSYRIVEVEPLDNTDTESLIIPRAVKSAKFALRHSSKSMSKKFSSSRRNLQIFEVIEEYGPNCVMLSPQDYMSVAYRSDNFSSNRVGISIALPLSEYYSTGISVLELEQKVKDHQYK